MASLVAPFGRRVILATAGAAVIAAPQARAQMVQPHPADRFVDSVGICAHIESAPYRDRFEDFLRMAALLGVRHLRDEIRPDNDRSRWRRLRADAGMRSHLLISPATNTVPEMLEFVLALGPDAVSAIEGQNEGDSPWFGAQPAARNGWAAAVIDYQREAYRAARRDVRLAAIPIVSPSVLDYQPADMRLLGPAAASCDVVALHAYVQRQQEPETDDAYASIDWYLRNMRDVFKPGAPAMVTEAGYATGIAGVSPAAAAKYLPRMLLHFFERGIARSFIYEFMDEGTETADPEQSYGLLTADAAPKPAFAALQLLLTTLADPGPRVPLAPISFGIASGPADLRTCVLQKRNGETIVALWRAARSWDPDTKADVDVPAAAVSLVVPIRSKAETILLAEGGSWSDVPLRQGRVTLDASDTIRLLRLVP